MNDTSELVQDVINVSAEIFNRICLELEKAEHTVLIASAWFTDPELFSVVKNKLEKGISVSLIIADNEENRKLDFDELSGIGATVIRIKNAGYGMMHQKFCVVDNRVAIHGSYNWSVNARKNNHESIIVTNHRQTINSLVEVFNDLKTKASDRNSTTQSGIKGKLKGFFSKSQHEEVEDEDLTELSKLDFLLKESSARFNKKAPNQLSGEPTHLQYERVLDSMISAEVSGFDRPLLRNQGFERSRLNNGDSQVLDTALDSVYSVFINDIDVIEDKKKRLIGKINEQKVKTADFLQTGLDVQLNKIETDAEETKSRLFQNNTDLKKSIEILEADIRSIENNKIAPVLDHNKRIVDEIKEKEREFIIPKHKLFELIPVACFCSILFIYLMLFYSSAAYILLFAESDAKMAKFATANPFAANPGVFNPKALTLAWDKGFVTLFFVLLFPFLPMAIALVDRFNVASKLLLGFFSIVGIILIDLFLAVQVSKTIHNVQYEQGKILGQWAWNHAFSDINMYLVLVMGAAGLFIFKMAFKKLMHLFEERNPTINQQKVSLHISQLKEAINDNLRQVQQLKLEIDAKEKEIFQDRAEILLNEAELENLPTMRANEIEKRKTEFHSKLQNIGQITDIYISHVENDNLPISIDSLKDRINVFLEGWNDYLHSEFSILKAVGKSSGAGEVTSRWLESKLANSKLDKRIKF